MLKYCLSLLLFFPNINFSQVSLNWVYSPKNLKIEGDQVTVFDIDVDENKYTYSTGQFDKTMDADPSSDTLLITSMASLDVFVAKHDSIGDLIWIFQLVGIGVDKPSAITLDNNGDFILTGTFQNELDFDPSTNNYILDAGQELDVFIAKYNSNGELIWAINFGNYEDMNLPSMTIDLNNNILITGTLEDTIIDIDPSPNYNWLENNAAKSIYVAKFSSSGELIWGFTNEGVNPVNFCYSSSIAVDNNQNIWISGYYQGTYDFDQTNDTLFITSSGNISSFFAVYNNNGSIKFVKSFTSTNQIETHSILVDESNDVFISGKFIGTADFDPSFNTIYDTSSEAFYSDVFITKFDSLGQLIWNKTLKGFGVDNIEVIAASTSELFIGGNYSDDLNAIPSNGKIYLSSLNSTNGTLNWHKQPHANGGAWVFDMIVKNNFLYIGGKFGDSTYFDPPLNHLLTTESISNHAGVIASYDFLGNFQFASEIGNYQSSEVANEHIKSFDFKSNGNIVLTGKFIHNFSPNPFNSSSELSTDYYNDVFLIELNSQGDIIWYKQFGSLDHDEPNSIFIDDDDNIFLSGTFRDDIDFDSTDLIPPLINQGQSDAFIIKLDSNGNLIWSKSIGGPGNQEFYMTKSNDNFIYASGKFSDITDFDPSPNDFIINGGPVVTIPFMAKYTLDGDLIWAKKIIASNGSTISEPLIFYDTMLVFTGAYFGNPDFDPGPGVAYGSSISSYGKLYIAKYDSSGNYISNFTMSDSQGMMGHSILMDENGNHYLSGGFYGNCNFNPNGAPFYLNAFINSAGGNSFLAKYDQNNILVFIETIPVCNLNWPFKLYFDPNYNIIQLGNFGVSTDFDPGPGLDILTAKGGWDIFIQSYDTTGNYLWSKSIVGFGYDRPLKLDFTDSSTFVISGNYDHITDLNMTSDNFFNSSLNGYDFYLANYSYCIPDIDSTTIINCNPLTINGQTMSSSGIYKIFDSNIFGCDSNLIVNFINNSSYSTITLNECFSYLSPSGNYLWFNSGVYIDTLINYLGCDSIISIYLSINNSDSIINTESCDEYISPAGNTYSISGTYNEIIPNSVGCDSTITINLTINDVDVSTNLNGSTITAINASADSYQWVNCDYGYAEIIGETNQNFLPNLNGNYAVIVSENGCVDTSACVNISGLELNQNSEVFFQVFPNPVTNELTILFDENTKVDEIKLIDTKGNLVFFQNTINQKSLRINMTDLSDGIYTLIIISEYSFESIQIVKK